MKFLSLMTYLILLLMTLPSLSLGEGYWDTELSPQSVASVPYGPGHISVWEHARTKGRYYAMPLVYLLNKSARTESNIVTAVQEMSFDVLMWSIEAREAVYLHIKNILNDSVTEDSVEMLPMEKIRIVWKNRLRPVASQYKLDDNWRTNTHLPYIVTFLFTCSENDSCEKLASAMKVSAHLFNSLELEYVINGQRSARRSLTVTGKHITQGNLWTKLMNMRTGGDVRYLTADDLKTITKDSINRVLASVVSDSDYVDTCDEVKLNDVLQIELANDQVSTQDFDAYMWDSVFWKDEWSRPDKLTHYLNKVISKDSKNDKNFLVNETTKSETAEGLTPAFMPVSQNESANDRIKKDEFLRRLSETHANIEWDGVKFRVKPMKLFRLNLSALNTSRSIAVASIQVHRYESVQTIKVRLTESQKNTPSLTPELVVARLTEKIRQQDKKIEKLDKNGWPVGHYCIFRSEDCPRGFSSHYGGISEIQLHTPSRYDVTPSWFGYSQIRCQGSNCQTAYFELYTCCK